MYLNDHLDLVSEQRAHAAARSTITQGQPAGAADVGVTVLDALTNARRGVR